ncbi:hypothetical protein [Streptomyces echinatus]|uniref:Uncharacterized protein n=1 Tax=Streptomyces echinatus TaxID=67293 RepID=A0A7W9UW67_9ACTN|nr:hypothetical protein [Streptomyces echinatus]MBB5932354.1 hypothetical protein [Streptomyces echinatus]
MTAQPARLLDCGHCYEEQGEEVHPHPECPIGQPGPAVDRTTVARALVALRAGNHITARLLLESAMNPADAAQSPAARDALRDRIAEALLTTRRTDYADLNVKADHRNHRFDARCALCAYDVDALTDAVLAVLPEQVDRAAVALAEVRRLCELTIKASVRVQAIDQARDTLTLIDRIMSGPPPATDDEGLSGPCDCGEGAMHYTAAECPAELRRLAGEQPTNSEARTQLASLAVNVANALRDEKRHYEIACRENAELRATVDRVRALHDSLEATSELTSPDDEITRGAAAKRIAAALDGYMPPPSV